MSRVSFALCVAVLVWTMGKAMGLPIWNEGWSVNAIGDRCDFTLAAVILGDFVYERFFRRG